MNDLVDDLRFEARRLLSPYPRLFLPLMRRRSAHQGHVIDDLTEVVIEGFPRSGNTFAVAAFGLAQNRPVNIARHLHAASHVREGIRRQLPVVVLVREPTEAVASAMIRHPGLSASQGLRQYITFHGSLVHDVDSLVVAPFETVITDFGTVIQALNRKFGCSFVPFDHTDENVTRCFEIVDEMDRLDQTQRSSDPSHTVARPMEQRDDAKQAVRSSLEGPQVQELVERARSLHRRFLHAALAGDSHDR